MSGYRLTDAEIQKALTQLPGWVVQNGKLRKKFEFKSFAEAIGWMVSVAIEAEKLGHHPEWFNVYNVVEVSLITYDLGHVLSNLDVELARIMEAITVLRSP